MMIQCQVISQQDCYQVQLVKCAVGIAIACFKSQHHIANDDHTDIPTCLCTPMKNNQ